MRTVKAQGYVRTLLLITCLFAVIGCGINELLGTQEKKTIIEPCLELVPTPAPTQVLNPTPEAGFGTPIPLRLHDSGEL